MECIFCTETVSQRTKEPDIGNEDEEVFKLFCVQLGIRIGRRYCPLGGLNNLPVCLECNQVYGQLKTLHSQLERVKGGIEQNVNLLREKVIASSNSARSKHNQFSKLSSKSKANVVQFRNSILNGNSASVYKDDASDTEEEVGEAQSSVEIDSRKPKLRITKSWTAETRTKGRPTTSTKSVTKLSSRSVQLPPDLETTVDVKVEEDESPEMEIDDEESFFKEFGIEPDPTSDNSDHDSEIECGSSELEGYHRSTAPERGERSEVAEGPGVLSTSSPLRISNFSTSTRNLRPRQSHGNVVVSSEDSEQDSDPDYKAPAAVNRTSYPSKKYQCEVCELWFLTRKGMIAHQDSMHRKVEVSFECSLCPRRFSKKLAFVRHLFKEHETEEKGLSCPTCGKKYTVQFLMDRHISLHKWDAEKPLACPYCEIRFRTSEQATLDHHVKINHTSRRITFSCTECNLTFSTKGKLMKHDHGHHPEKFSFACSHPNCDKRYSAQQFLDTHLKTHSDAGPYTCRVCLKEFVASPDLSDHLLFHTKEPTKKPPKHKCSECEEAFQDSIKLQRHRSNKHGEEKPFECKFCHKRFIQEGEKKVHEAYVHEQPEDLKRLCDLCGREFSNPRNLRNHIARRHELKDAADCHICGKHLLSSQALKNHIRLHTGERPYLCSVCGKGFIELQAMKRHLKARHSQDEGVQQNAEVGNQSNDTEAVLYYF